MSIPRNPVILWALYRSLSPSPDNFILSRSSLDGIDLNMVFSRYSNSEDRVALVTALILFTFCRVS